MRKSCGFCSFATDDEAVFADHVSAVHGWGQPRRSPLAPEADRAVGATVYCYFCSRPNLGSRERCFSCGELLSLADSGRRFGHAYALNELAQLLELGLIDPATAERVRAHHLAALGLAAGTPPPIAPIERGGEPAPASAPAAVPLAPIGMPPRTPERARPEPAGPGLFSPERAPSLLLYVGAFLVVVAALIFVNVSGEQISGATKLVLLIVGTVAFLGVGLACHRYPRVLEAGRTFLAIGALLVPLDFAAYYVLTSGTALSPATLLTLGALVSAGLYGALAVAGFGRIYAYLFLPAALATVVGMEGSLDVPGEWTVLPLAFVPMALALARARLADERLDRLAAPLERAGRIVVAVALAVSLAIVLLGDRVALDRRVATAAFAVAAAYYGVRSRHGATWERWAAVLAPGAAALSLPYVLRAPLQTYGFTLTFVAYAYAVAADAFRLGATRLPAWAAAAAWRVAIASVALALLPTDAYWRAPFTGALVNIALGAGLVAASLRRASERISFVPVLLVVGVGALHLGELLLLLGLGLVQGASRPYAGLVGREVALAFVPLSAVLAAAAWAARPRLPQLQRELAGLALASTATTLAFAFEYAPLATILPAVAGVLLVLAARAARVPGGLWLAAAALAYSVLNLDRWIAPPSEAWPPILAALALLVFVPASHVRWRWGTFTPTVRQIGLATAATAMLVGLGNVLATPLARGEDPFSLPLWLATVPAVVVYGGLGVANGILRRSEPEVVGSTAFFLGAVLMVVARLRPDPIEAYALPVALYLTLVAWGVWRWQSRLRTSLEQPARVGAALALTLPTYLYTWSGDDVLRGVAVLAGAFGVLAVAIRLRDAALAWTSFGVLGLMAYRATASPLAFESATAAFGALVVGLGLAARRYLPGRLGEQEWEAGEIAASALVVLPPLARAIARGPDALDQGASVLAAAVLLAAIALWSGRRVLLGAGIGAAAAVGVLALPDSERAEPYVAAAGIAFVGLALLVGRVLPRRLPLTHERALELTGAALILSGAAQRMAVSGDAAAVRFAVESVVLVAAGIALARPAIAYAGLGGAALLVVWVAGDPSSRELHGILVGAALIALGLYAARWAPALLDPRAMVAMETGGALLFIGPTLVAGWGEPFFPRTPMVFFETFLVLGVGIALHRRWLVAGALAALGLEAIRGLIDAVDRLPNYVLFAASGALSLAIGFVLLLKREAWREWSRRMLAWWIRL